MTELSQRHFSKDLHSEHRLHHRLPTNTIILVGHQIIKNQDYQGDSFYYILQKKTSLSITKVNYSYLFVYGIGCFQLFLLLISCMIRSDLRENYNNTRFYIILNFWCMICMQCKY